MDNLTHGLVGYAVYRLARPEQATDAVTERRLMWAAVIASELPDIDMVSTFFGDAAGLLWHRTYTHSLPGILVLTLALSVMLMKFWSGIPRRRLWGLVLCGGLLHSFFDLLTSYGTKVLLPWVDTPLRLGCSAYHRPVFAGFTGFVRMDKPAVFLEDGAMGTGGADGRVYRLARVPA